MDRRTRSQSWEYVVSAWIGKLFIVAGTTNTRRSVSYALGWWLHWCNSSGIARPACFVPMELDCDQLDVSSDV